MFSSCYESCYESCNSLISNKSQVACVFKALFLSPSYFFHDHSGADLAALVREAAVTALRESMARPETDGDTTRVSRQHFNTAFDKIRPSVSEKVRIWDKDSKL